MFKSAQRCPRTWRQWIRGLLGRQCPSYLGTWYDGDYHFCTEVSGHKGKHKSLLTRVSWGYGDNWLEMSTDSVPLEDK